MNHSKKHKSNTFTDYQRVATKLLIVLFLILHLQGIAQDREGYSLLWEFKHPDSNNKGYLFGTMHLQDASVFNFSDQHLEAMENSEVFAMEIHPDSLLNSMDQWTNGIDFRGRYKKLLGEQDYKVLNEKLIELIGVPLDSISDNSVDGIESRIKREVLKDRQDVETFLDAYLYGVARSMKKEIAGLEMPEHQMTDYSAMTDDEILVGLTSIRSITKENFLSSLDDMIEIYVSGDISRIDEYVNESNNEEGKARMLSRNRVMTNSIDSILRENTLFAAVGAAHLPGNNGIIQMLKDKGYKVNKVATTFNTNVKELMSTKGLDYWETIKDDARGFKIKVPSQEITIKEMENSGASAYVDLVTGVTIFTFSIDIPVEKQANRLDMIDELLNNFTKRMDIIYEKKDLGAVNGVEHGSSIGEKAGKKFRIDLFMSQAAVYILGAEYNDAPNSITASNYFFDNVSFYEPIVAETQMIKVTDSIGAFSVQLPDNYTFSKKNTPAPSVENLNYEMNLYSSIDSKNKTIYLLRYNDFPVGYHLNELSENIDSYIENIKIKGIKILEEERTKIKGLDAVDLNVTLQNGLPARIRLIYRANRTYLLLVQKSEPNLSISKNNVLFNSFKLEPFEPLILESIEEDDYSLEFPKNRNRTFDDSILNESEFISVTDFAGRSDVSGDVYVAGVTQLGDYFKISIPEKEYIKDYMKLLLTENDSIYVEQSFKSRDYKGTEFYVSNANSAIAKRYRVFFTGDKLVFLGTMQDRSRIASEQNNQYFNSFTNKTSNNFDVKASKSSLLLKDLISTDSLTFNKAHQALDYYAFEKSDLSKLTAYSKKSYPNDSIYYGAKNMLLLNIALLKDDKSLPYFEELYKDESTSSETRGLIIEALALYENHKATDLSFKLASTNLLNASYGNELTYLEAGQDSLITIAKYGNKILELDNNLLFHKNNLAYFERKVENGNGALNFIKSNQLGFETNFKRDVQIALDSVQSSKNNFYTYHLNPYFTIFDSLTVKDPEILKLIEQVAYQEDNRGYTNLLAFEYLLNHQEVPKTEKIQQFIKPLYYRLEGMQELTKAGKQDLIPASYLEPREFAHLSVYNSLYDYDSNAVIKYLDIYKYDGEEYFLFQFNYADEDPDNPENFLAIVRKEPIDLDELNMFTVEFTYDTFDTDWLKAVQEYFSDLEKQE